MEPMSLPVFNRSKIWTESLQQRLRVVIERDGRGWTYAIFWELCPLDQGLLLGWGDGYYEGENENAKVKKNSFSSFSPTYVAEQQHRKRVLADLNSLMTGSTEEAIDEDVTDAEWFFLMSMTQSFQNNVGLPGMAWHSSSPLWITGANKLANCHCERAHQAQGFGIQTMALTRTANGVVELGSTALIFPGIEFGMVAKIRLLFDSRFGQRGGSNSGLDLNFEPVQSENESESSNSVGNIAEDQSTSLFPSQEINSNFNWDLDPWNAGVQSNPSLPTKKSDLSWGSDFNEPENESTSQDSVRNYPKVRRKLIFPKNSQFRGDSDSDKSDINAFIQILRGG